MFGDSWATNASKAAAGQAGGQAGALFGEGQGIQSQLMPFLRGEMTANHAFNPTQLNDMLSSAGAGAGGAAGSLGGEAGLAAARTGNSAGQSDLLDKIARAKTQGLAHANEGIASMDAMQTQQNKQAGAAGMGNLYGADTGDAMKAMGLQNQSIDSEMKAANTGGWFRNLMGTLGDMSNIASKSAGIAGGYGG